MLTVMLPWRDGFKAEVSSAKHGGKKDGAVMSFGRVGGTRKPAMSKTFRPSGTLAVVSAPKGPNEVGRVTLDVTSGAYRLFGDADVELCGSTK